MKSIFVLLISFVCHIQVQAQDYSKVFAAADTSRFSANTKEGWQLFNSYVKSISQDSVTLELIIQHINNIDLTTEQYVGKIKKSSLIPLCTQTLPFHLLNDCYYLKIDNKGRCFLRFVQGTIPSADAIILPLKVFYKL
ncbi:MAG: hypothetical protein J0H55_16640 [Chitinophagaceae bacterium]|nr:hypothetical protein [Chitinophagaceae bacterium]MCZ2337815.1 hypothetical protein [Chitinophagales bacterium]